MSTPLRVDGERTTDSSAVRPAGAMPVLGMATYALLAIAFCALMQLVLEPALTQRTSDSFATDSLLLTANALPPALVALTLFAISRRFVTSLAWTFVLLAILHAANAIKLEHLELPLLPADLRFVAVQRASATVLANYVGVGDLVAPMLALAGALLAHRLERRLGWFSLRRRAMLGSLCLVAGATLVAGTTPWQRLYDAEALGFQPWDPTESARNGGLLPTLLQFRWALSGEPAPIPDHERALQALVAGASLLQAARPQPAPESLPDIVVLQSESFFDPERIAGMPMATTLPNYRALARHGASGALHVPTFAGNTIRTEFEVLTGISLDIFPGVEYPYYELLDQPVPSLPRALAARGYSVTALHPNDAGFWNRGPAFANLGIERFLSLRDFEQPVRTGLFVADAVLTDRVLAELRDEGPPQFLFAISMEAHGPYDYRPGLDPVRLQAIALPEGLTPYATLTLRHCLYHLENADHELGRLAAALMARDRPTLLLFYGDHLPGLHSTYAQTGFADGADKLAQATPWLMLDNRSLTHRHEDLSAWQLPALLLDAAGVGGDPYFALVSALRNSTQSDPAAAEALLAAISDLGLLQYRGAFGRALDEAMAATGLAIETDATMPTASTPGAVN